MEIPRHEKANPGNNPPKIRRASMDESKKYRYRQEKEPMDGQDDFGKERIYFFGKHSKIDMNAWYRQVSQSRYRSGKLMRLFEQILSFQPGGKKLGSTG